MELWVKIQLTGVDGGAGQAGCLQILLNLGFLCKRASANCLPLPQWWNSNSLSKWCNAYFPFDNLLL